MKNWYYHYAPSPENKCDFMKRLCSSKVPLENIKLHEDYVYYYHVEEIK
jgi:hypothetical protein